MVAEKDLDFIAGEWKVNSAGFEIAFDWKHDGKSGAFQITSSQSDFPTGRRKAVERFLLDVFQRQGGIDKHMVNGGFAKSRFQAIAKFKQVVLACLPVIAPTIIADDVFFAKYHSP